MQKFQDLEEERLDFMKSSLWTFANVASTICVSDDAVSITANSHKSRLIQVSPVKRYDYHSRVARSRKIF